MKKSNSNKFDAMPKFAELEEDLNFVTAVCYSLKIPFMYSAAVKDTGVNTKYKYKIISPVVCNRKVSKNLINKYALIMKGCEVFLGEEPEEFTIQDGGRINSHNRFDKTADFARVEHHLKILIAKCRGLGIPFVYAAAVKDDGITTEYKYDIVHPASVKRNLSRNLIDKYGMVLNGGIVFPLGEEAEVLEVQIKPKTAHVINAIDSDDELDDWDF